MNLSFSWVLPALAFALPVAIMGIEAAAHAAEPVEVESGSQVWLEVPDVDDVVTCALVDIGDGKPIANPMTWRAQFGVPLGKKNVTSYLGVGTNRIRCQAFDTQGGTCFAYKINFYVDQKLVISDAKSCCATACAVPKDDQNIVFDFTYTIRYRVSPAKMQSVPTAPPPLSVPGPG